MVKLRILLFVLVAGIMARAAFGHFYHNGSTTAWTYIINMDGRGYYAYLPAVFIHHDPSYQFHRTYNAQRDDNINFTHESENGKRLNKYFVGEAVLLSPFFLVAHAAAHVMGSGTHGYSPPYYIAVSVAAIFYTVCGLWLLSIFLREQFGSDRILLLVPVLVLFGTNLFYYAVYEPSMSHAYSFFLVCCFLYVGVRTVRSYRVSLLLLLGVVIGLIAITRPVNLIILAMLPFLLLDDSDLPTMSISTLLKRAALVVLGCGPVVAIQLLAYHWQTGNWLEYSYRGEGFNWADPQIFNTLFSYKRGLFVYSPVCLLSLFGLVPLWKRSAVKATAVAFTLLLAIYVVSSWHDWGYGWAYGLRAYVEFLPLFAILLAALLTHVRPRPGVVILSIALLCVAYTQIQTHQVANKILPLSGVDSTQFWEILLQF